MITTKEMAKDIATMISDRINANMMRILVLAIMCLVLGIITIMQGVTIDKLSVAVDMLAQAGNTASHASSASDDATMTILINHESKLWALEQAVYDID